MKRNIYKILVFFMILVVVVNVSVSFENSDGRGFVHVGSEVQAANDIVYYEDIDIHYLYVRDWNGGNDPYSVLFDVWMTISDKEYPKVSDYVNGSHVSLKNIQYDPANQKFSFTAPSFYWNLSCRDTLSRYPELKVYLNTAKTKPLYNSFYHSVSSSVNSGWNPFMMYGNEVNWWDDVGHVIPNKTFSNIQPDGPTRYPVLNYPGSVPGLADLLYYGRGDPLYEIYDNPITSSEASSTTSIEFEFSWSVSGSGYWQIKTYSVPLKKKNIIPLISLSSPSQNETLSIISSRERMDA